MDWADIERYIGNRRLNAGLAWLLVGLVAAVAVGSVLIGDLLWAGFAAGVAALALLPAVVYRSPGAMLPWEVLVLAALPIVGYAFGNEEVSDFAMYLSVAALALIVTLELQLLTAVEMNTGFAVFFVVIATMATAGIWGVTRWVADIYLGTGFLSTPNALMWEFVASTTAGAAASVAFEFYFRRRGRAGERFVAEGERI
jgi:hypothetical protein